MPRRKDTPGAEPLRFGEALVAPGEGADVQLPAARLPTGTWIYLPIKILHGRMAGPRLWLSATLHGDELNGMEIIRQVLERLDPRKLRGSLLAAPVVNVFGLLAQSRYLPDRRDLNRSFPGSPRGSLTGRLAYLFVEAIVERCQYGIDFHTGAAQRTNLPQIRADLTDRETRQLAAAFGAPLMYQGREIAGTLRATARKKGVSCLTFEGGEPLRFNPPVIEAGVAGTLRVMAALGMWRAPHLPAPAKTFEASSTRWVRANRSGIFHREVELGDRVVAGQVLGLIRDPLTNSLRPVLAPEDALVFAVTQNPLVYRGDALVHLASG